MRRAAAALVQLSVAALASAHAGGCSLMDLGDFGLACEQPSQCDALNERDGLGAGDCVIWQCRKDKRGCEKRPRDLDGDERLDAVACADRPGPLDCADDDPHRSPDLSESCDSKDNDCDGLIDEDVAPELEQNAVGNVQAPDFLSYTQDRSDALYLMLGTPDAARGWVVASGEPSEHPVSYALPGSPNSKKGFACRGKDRQLVQCSFSELAVAAVGGELVSAGVNTVSCHSGQLVVGLGDQTDFSMQLGSAAQDSNLEWGVDIVDACTVTDGAMGARGVRIAALDDDGDRPEPQALALWLAASSAKACTDDAPLAAIALWPHADSSERWLEGGNGGHGETLGTSAGCGAPSITAVRAGKNSGYALAYPGASTVELIWLPRPSALDASLRALAVHASVPAAEPSHVALALLPEGEPTKNGRGLLVAFRAGNAIGFAPIGWNASGLTPGEPQTLERNAEITAGPVAAYATSGFVEDAGDGESRGGWLIVWAERDAQGSHLLALRVADAGGGTMLGTPVALEGSADPGFPFVCVAGASGFEYGFVANDGSASQLTLGGLSCPARD